MLLCIELKSSQIFRNIINKKIRSFAVRANHNFVRSEHLFQEISNKDRDGGYLTYGIKAIPFSIYTDKAIRKFHEWRDDHDVTLFFDDRSVSIEALMLPFWTFDLYLRFQDHSSLKPSVLQAYKILQEETGSTIFLPGMSSYAGYLYKQDAHNLLNVVHSSSLLFEKSNDLNNDHIVKADPVKNLLPWMLDDLPYRQGDGLPVYSDAWGSSLMDSLTSMLRNCLVPFLFRTHDETLSSSIDVMVKSATRLYLPTYVIKYKVLGTQFQAFASGWSIDSTVSGIPRVLKKDILDEGEPIKLLKNHCSLFRKSECIDCYSNIDLIKSWALVLITNKNNSKFKKEINALRVHSKNKSISLNISTDSSKIISKHKFNEAEHYFSTRRKHVTSSLSGVDVDKLVMQISDNTELYERFLEQDERSDNFLLNIVREQEWYEELNNGWHTSQKAELFKKLKKEKIVKEAKSIDDFSGEFTYFRSHRSNLNNVHQEQDYFDNITKTMKATSYEYKEKMLTKKFQKKILLNHPDIWPFASRLEREIARSKVEEIVKVYRNERKRIKQLKLQ